MIAIQIEIASCNLYIYLLILIGSSFHPPRNDGTNACVFLALKICEQISKRPSEINQLCDLMENIIRSFPIHINKCRDISNQYEAEEALNILLAKKLVKDIHLELKSKDRRLYSPDGMKELPDIFNCEGVFLVTVPPYTFVVWKKEKEMWIMDTHAVSLDLGGNGNAIVVIFPDVKSGISWLCQRLVTSAVIDSFQQIYAVRTRSHHALSMDNNRYSQTR